MVTGEVMAGSLPRPVAPTAMVFTPVPGMAKFMVSAPALELASSMAALSEHDPPNPQNPSPVIVSWKSLVELTVRAVEAWTGGLATSARHMATKSATIPTGIIILLVIIAFSLVSPATPGGLLRWRELWSLLWPSESARLPIGGAYFLERPREGLHRQGA